MKCDICNHRKEHTTGIDEYPQLTSLEYCEKGHWENNISINNAQKIEVDIWDKCSDFEEVI